MFLESEISAENIVFYTKIESLIHPPPPNDFCDINEDESFLLDFSYLVHQHIDEGSEEEVNIPSDLRSKILKIKTSHVLDPPTKTNVLKLLALAQKEVVIIMVGALDRFVDSPMFKEYLVDNGDSVKVLSFIKTKRHSIFRLPSIRASLARQLPPLEPTVYRILLIKKHKMMAHIIQRELSRVGYTVDFVASLKDALQYLQKYVYGTILLSTELPAYLTLIPCHSKDPLSLNLSEPHFVVMVKNAGDTNAIQRRRALKDGFSDVLLKPFSLEDIIRVLKRTRKRSMFEWGK